MKKKFLHTAVAALVLTATAVGSPDACAQTLIDSADIEQYSGHANINVNFVVPIGIDSITPPTKGNYIQIQVRRAGKHAEGESFDPSPWLANALSEPGSPYESIRFEQHSPDSGVILIKLKATREYTVYRSADSRRVVMSLLNPNTGERVSPRIAPIKGETVASSAPASPAQPGLSSEPSTTATETDPKLIALMEEARQAMARQDYTRAVQIYTKVLQQGESASGQQALEFLGVARERKGQKAHAKAIYEQYLAKYSGEQDQRRVKQRLAGLITQTQAPKEKRRVAKKEKEKRRAAEWTVFGGFSQYYRYADLTVDDDLSAGEQTDRIESSLTSDAYISARLRTEDWDIRTRFSGGYINDFLEDSDGDESRLSDLYVNLESRHSGRSFRLGRQSSSSGGVLGRFDGLRAGFPLTEQLQLNLVTGFPVNTSTDVDVESGHLFYGANVDFEPYDTAWQFNAFLIEQKAESLVDRQAVGGEARYFDAGRSMFALLDYDIYYDDLNTLLLIGNWTTESNTTFSLTYDQRNSPVLTTTNAIQGQLVDNVEDLLDTYTEDELQAIAEDRTADSKFINIGISHPLSESIQLYSNLTMTNFSDMPASAGIEALEGSGNEYSYDVQLLFNGLLFDGDTNIFALRYFDGSTSTRKTFSFDARYPATRYLRINPRMRVDLRNNLNNDTDQWVFRPSLRMDYRWQRRYHLEVEMGGEWSTRELTDDVDEDIKGLFGTLGYRVDF